MELCSLLLLLCVSEVFQQGGTALIETQQFVTVEIGGDAHLSCRLMETKDVVRVTWFQISPHPERFLAFYTQKFGERLNFDLRGKVAFTRAALQSSTIVIRNVTVQDEGCYQCVFDTSSEGALRNQSCLQVCELHEPVLHVEGSPEEAVVSCSATGRPSPSVTLSVLRPDLHLSRHSSVTVNNANRTATVTTTAVLSGFHGSAQVGCTMRVLSGPQMEVFRTLPGKEQSSPDVTVIAAVVLIVLVCICAAAVLLIMSWLKQKQENRNSENDGTPQNSTPPTQGTEMPLLQHENERLRQRRSSIGNEVTVKATSVKLLYMQLLPEESTQSIYPNTLGTNKLLGPTNPNRLLQ